ncbi:MAG TPA: hypothetical protein VMD78_10510 [Candidatus Baltobacteraceae bacterium]|nr:hypothetical protein [Candidatus Baltobacteraceae bacterium]
MSVRPPETPAVVSAPAAEVPAAAKMTTATCVTASSAVLRKRALRA